MSKKNYISPKLIVHGDVNKLTKESAKPNPGATDSTMSKPPGQQ